jgi:hypothetical protein
MAASAFVNIAPMRSSSSITAPRLDASWWSGGLASVAAMLSNSRFSATPERGDGEIVASGPSDRDSSDPCAGRECLGFVAGLQRVVAARTRTVGEPGLA